MNESKCFNCSVKIVQNSVDSGLFSLSSPLRCDAIICRSFEDKTIRDKERLRKENFRSTQVSGNKSKEF